MIKDQLLKVLWQAYRLSPRVGVAWALMNSEGKLLDSDAFVLGAKSKRLSNSILHQTDAKQLIVSVEPNDYAFDVQDLISALDQSSIANITLLYRLPAGVVNTAWRLWEKCWQGEVTVAKASGVAHRLNRRVALSMGKNRPWITCINAACIDGRLVELAALVKYSEFKLFTNGLVSEVDAVAYAPSQSGLIESLPSLNYKNNSIRYTPIHTNEDLLRWISTNQKHNTLHSIVLCDMEILDMALQESSVDEIVHHVTHKADQNSRYYEKHLTGLESWTILQSRVIGECNRVIYQKAGSIGLSA